MTPKVKAAKQEQPDPTVLRAVRGIVQAPDAPVGAVNRVRYIHVVAGVVRNVVDYPDDNPVPEIDQQTGAIVIPDPTGRTNVGDAYDQLDADRERLFAAVPTVIKKELFRLTNEIRALRGEAALTVNQYKAQVKAAN